MAFRFICPLLLLSVLAGCHWLRGPEILMPVQPTATEQYRFAVTQRESISTRLIREPQRLKAARDRTRRAFEMVSENFPDDRTFTPLARLEVIEMRAGLDHPLVDVSRSQLRDCVHDLKTLAEAYPEYDFVQAKSLYNQGQCYRKLGEFKAAQEAFRGVRDKYINHQNEVIKALAKQAADLYNEVYVNE